MTAAFLQAEQDLGLDQRGQAAQDDLMAAGDRGAGPAPGREVGDRSACPRAVLLPPADIVRAAQSPPAHAPAGCRPRPGTGRSPAAAPLAGWRRKSSSGSLSRVRRCSWV